MAGCGGGCKYVCTHALQAHGFLLGIAGRVSPRQATHLSVAQKGGPKMRPCRPRPFASLRATCGARVRAIPHNSLRATRFVQTDAVSQFTVQLHSAVQLPSPHPVLLGAGRKGVESQPGPSLRSASLWGRAYDGPYGCLAVGLLTPFACACGVVFAGWHWHRRVPVLRDLACRVCLNAARSAQ